MKTLNTIEVTTAELAAWMVGDLTIHCKTCGTELLPPHRVRVGMLAARCQQCLYAQFVAIRVEVPT